MRQKKRTTEQDDITGASCNMLVTAAGVCPGELKWSVDS